MTINITNSSAVGFFKASIVLFSVLCFSIMIVFTISILHMAKIINYFENVAAIWGLSRYKLKTFSITIILDQVLNLVIRQNLVILHN